MISIWEERVVLHYATQTPPRDDLYGLGCAGVIGGVGFGVLSTLMFLFRAQAEPIVRFILPILAGHRSHYRYNPESYFLWPSLVGFCAVLWLALCVIALVRKPSDDRAIDAALKAKYRPAARGAPLEPM